MTPAAPRPHNRSGGPGMTIILICFVIAGAATLGVWAYWNKKYKQPRIEEKARTEKEAAAKKSAGTNSNPIAKAADTLKKVEATNREGEKTAEAMKAPAPVPAPAATAASATSPKLQAIFYRLNDATAVLSGKTVRVGDEVEGFKVIEIKRQSVRIQKEGDVRELLMQ